MFHDSIDPFLLQLVILPIVSIVLGIAVSLFKKQIILAPIVTFIAFILTYSMFFHFFPLLIGLVCTLISWLIAYTLIRTIEIGKQMKRKN